jgi:8-oxo-dGTP pyrophosphatase MutT (NUDIX family)
MAPHLAASVILLREPRSGSLEVCMLRRRRGASFMASACVFPGGGVDAGESLQECAARELFEEAGVALVASAQPDANPAGAVAPDLEDLRSQMTAAGAVAATILADAGLRWQVEGLAPWSHWITPSLEPKRFDAHFFVAALPPGQAARFDAVETVQQVWVNPADATARSEELNLPPPQLRTLWELGALRSIEEVFAAARERAMAPHPILPRVLAASAPPLCLLLPWDPDYLERGQGEALPMTRPPAWAHGPSRFVMEDRAWRHLDAPGSTSAG